MLHSVCFIRDKWVFQLWFVPKILLKFDIFCNFYGCHNWWLPTCSEKFTSYIVCPLTPKLRVSVTPASLSPDLIEFPAKGQILKYTTQRPRPLWTLSCHCINVALIVVVTTVKLFRQSRSNVEHLK